MKKIFFCLVLLTIAASAYAQKEIRTQISYDPPAAKVLKWDNDSIAPFKIDGDYIKYTKVYELPGMDKDAIFSAIMDYLVTKYSHITDMIKDKDRSTGRIAASYCKEGHISTSKLTQSKYECSRTILIEIKEAKARITFSLTHLAWGIHDSPRLGEPIIIVNDDIANCYPLSAPKKKKPNYWEKFVPQILRQEVSEALRLTEEIIESVHSGSEDW